MNTSKIFGLGIAAIAALVLLGGSLIWSACIGNFLPVGGSLVILAIALLLFGKKIFPTFKEE